jgi:hypothetical protein
MNARGYDSKQMGDACEMLLAAELTLAGVPAELATVEGISDRYVSSLLPLAFLAPDIVEAIAAGRQPPELTAHCLIRTVDLPIAWTAQKQLLGLV